jgi:two-component system chemotaxis sensor kinase CheA
VNPDLSSALETYAVESRELLEQMESALLTMESSGPDAELINAVFRAAHTIKGSGGLFGLDDVVAFTHDAETTLDVVRDGHLAMDGELIGLFLKCRDHMGALVEASIAGEVPADLLVAGETLQARLRASLGQPAAAKPDHTDSDAWHISMQCGQDLFRDGMDPLSILHYLATLGELVRVETLKDALPKLSDFDPESCYLSFEIDLISDLDKAEIEDAFEFVRSSSQVQILPPSGKLEEWSEQIRTSLQEDDKLGEILVKSGAVTRGELAAALGAQGATETAKPLGEILVERGAPREVVSTALDKQAREGKAKGEQYVRVEAAKLDRLINLVGELVISNTVTSLRAEGIGDAGLNEAVKTAGRFVEEVRDAALGLRMVQIGSTFLRFQRVVRDLSHELGKRIDLLITGGETDLDKTVVDRIGDPLTHLVRNAMDHGIEGAEERLASGKSAAGTLRLNAYHESGSIVVEVRDDGRGLDRGRIVAKAISRGLIVDEEGMSDQDIYRLIFEPGFSTAEQVSNVSGRGVGMDVVKRTIEDLRGAVEVDSEAGRGTTVRLRLPLTLAIIDGFLVQAGESRFVIPLEMVEECVELPDLSRRSYIDLRGEVLPYLRLRDLFVAGGEEPERQVMVVVGYAGKKAGLVVDRLLGELQTVIKPLGEIFTPLKWVSGCTVLDIGEVGLILDVPALVAKAERRENQMLREKAAKERI